MNKWLFIDNEIINLERMNKMNLTENDGTFRLWVEIDNKVIIVCLGDETKVKMQYKAIKDFIKSSESYLDMD